MDRFPPNDIISLVGSAPRHDLAESVGPDLHVGELFDREALAALAQLRLGYASAEGDTRLREAIAAAHGAHADNVVVTMGGMHALFLLAFTLCGAGDEAVVASPLFPLARNSLEAVGAAVRTWPFAFDRGYQPDLAELRRLLSPRTRLVSLASPQNPSGVALSHEILREVVSMMDAICPEARLLVDETYREAAYGDDAVAPSAIALGPRVVSVASLSKCHGAPGLRVGWAITRDRVLREQLVRGKFNTVISCSPVDEALALRVLAQRERIVGERRERLAQGLALVAQWVGAQARWVDWVRPDAGALCCVRLKPAVFDEAAVGRFHAALPGHDVRVAPGSWFGEDARVFRLGFGLLPPSQLEAALSALGAALRESA